MPSPVGHALAGVAAGCFTGGGRGGGVVARPVGLHSVAKLFSDKRVVTFGLLGVLADIDFLFGIHSAYTHSIGAIVVVAALASLVGPERGASFGVAAAAAYGSHVLLDWLGSDEAVPIGIMALWPLSSDFFLSDRYWFMSVCRKYWLLDCWWHNARGLAYEVLVLGPVAFGAMYVTGRVSAR